MGTYIHYLESGSDLDFWDWLEDYSPTKNDLELLELHHYQLIYENERVKLYLPRSTLLQRFIY